MYNLFAVLWFLSGFSGGMLLLWHDNPREVKFTAVVGVCLWTITGPVALMAAGILARSE